MSAWTPYHLKAKKINWWGVEPYAFPISSQTAAILAFSTDFSLFHTPDICSQIPGTLAIQPFWIEKLLVLVLVIIWYYIFLKTKLKYIFPSTFKKATSWTFLTSDGFGGLVFGMYTSDICLCVCLSACMYEGMYVCMYEVNCGIT